MTNAHERWNPTPEEREKMLQLREEGVPYRKIAVIMGRGPTVVERWLLNLGGRVVSYRRMAYHGKEATHKRGGIYFDVSKMAEELRETD